MTRRRTVALVAVALLVSLPILEQLFSVFTGGRSTEDVAGSSYSTGPDGVRAWSELLAAQGRTVVRAREPFDQRAPAADDVVIEVDVSSSRAENAALARHLADGGRIVVVGAAGAPTAGALVGGEPLTWVADGAASSRPLTAAPETATVHGISGDGIGAWRPAPGSAWRVLLGDESEAVVVAADVGPGRVIAIADPSVIANRRLAVAGNAALAIGLAGERGRVVFAEAGHGFGTSGGLGALPGPWRAALALAVVATAVWMWSRAKRFGAPDLEPGSPAPSRALYVESLASSLARTRDRPRAAEPLRRWLEDESRRSGPTAGTDAVLDHPTRDDRDLVALGIAAADQAGRHP